MRGSLFSRCVFLLTLLLVGAGLTGCGQKGDLYLPDQQSKKDDKRT